MKMEKSVSDEQKQYTLTKILMIWLLATFPNAVTMWVIVPGLIPKVRVHPGLLFWTLIILCLLWQFLLSLWLLSKEVGKFDWAAIKQRLWLNRPVNPKTDKKSTAMYWWLIPCILFSALITVAFAGFLDGWIVNVFPALTMPAYSDLSGLLIPQLIGKWWLLVYAIVHCAFNYVLGEELLFRGILLPKMAGVFGKWDWVANAFLFGLYHLHKPWMIPSILIGSLAYCWPARRFRCFWMAVIVHGIEGIFVFLTVIAAIGGLPVR